MTPLNPLYAIIVFLIAYATGYLIPLKYKPKNEVGRYETIDGLRGFLALGVFIHHTCVWYFYIHSGSWHGPNSNLYNQLGQTSVSLFFMITSFLFISKLINSKEKTFNWVAFFISRLCRLVPMYYVSITILFAIVMILSHWQVNVSLFEFLTSLFHWSVFTITTAPTINNIALTHHINAGVVWSLPFEWLFYFSLPLLSLLILKLKPSKFYIVISILFLSGFIFAHGLKMQHILSFCGGAIAPFLMRFPAIIKIAKSVTSSFIIAICLFLILQFYSSDTIACKSIITILFTLIALGNTFFGLLRNTTLKFLGEMAYSTYLLHGILLFVVFYFGIGIEKVKEFTSTEYAILVFSTTPFLVLLSFFGFKYVEKPFMDKAKKITQLFQSNR